MHKIALFKIAIQGNNHRDSLNGPTGLKEKTVLLHIWSSDIPKRGGGGTRL